MVQMIFMQVALYFVACNVLINASGHCSENWKNEEGSISSCQATESSSNDFRSIPELLNHLHSVLAGFPRSQQKVDDERATVKEQRDKSKDSSDGKSKVKKVITTMISSIKKIQSKDPLKILMGVLDIVSTITNLLGINIPYVDEVQTFFTILSSLLLTETKPSVVDQLANVVHDEMIQFNSRLHAQKYHGLKRRLSEQISQLRQMREGEKLDDQYLWNDYAQFLGELAFRFGSPLPFKYENNLLKDSNVKDFLTAVVMYSETHSLFMALLLVAKGKYVELRIAHEDDIAIVERRMNFQSTDAKEKLSFLSEERFLTFPEGIEGGKITKIVALSRRTSDKHVVEAVRHSLGLSPMPDLLTVESSAKKVNQQFVNLRSVEKCSWYKTYFAPWLFIEFNNDVNYSMKIVSGEIGWSHESQLKFVQNISRYWWHHQKIYYSFSTAGYITLYFNNNQRVIQFAVSFVFYDSKIGLIMQDTTEEKFSSGLAAYNTRSEDPVTLNFSEDGKHYTVKAEIFVCWPNRIWRFTFREAPGDYEH